MMRARPRPRAADSAACQLLRMRSRRRKTRFRASGESPSLKPVTCRAFSSAQRSNVSSTPRLSGRSRVQPPKASKAMGRNSSVGGMYL